MFILVTITQKTNRFTQPIQANVMLEYELDAAEALLNKNLSNAHTKLEQTITDLDFLRFVNMYYRYWRNTADYSFIIL